ncbi:MAG: hypothetical protein AABY15_00385 [Nanoarchaeota archaeon]
MKNKLGHDDESEIKTVIKRMQEGLFSILSVNESGFNFEIKLTHRITVPVPSFSYTIVHYELKRKDIENASYEYSFEQVKGKPVRIIGLIDGFIIWSLLEEKLDKEI